MWRDPATPSDAVYHAKAPAKLDANGRWGLHRSDIFWGVEEEVEYSKDSKNIPKLEAAVDIPA
jgi:hypothetical protein